MGGPGELASRGSRLAANIVDNLLVFGPFLLAAGLASLLDESRFPNVDVIFMLIASTGALAVVVADLVLLHRHGQTLAKRMLKIRVTRGDGRRVGVGRIIGMRFLPVFLLQYIPYLGGAIGLLNALLIFQHSRRCLHDLIADTIVVKA